MIDEVQYRLAQFQVIERRLNMVEAQDPVIAERVDGGDDDVLVGGKYRDQVCRRLMSVPEIGALVSLTYRTARAVRDVKSVGAFFGLTPKRCQAGETDVTGGILRWRASSPPRAKEHTAA